MEYDIVIVGGGPAGLSLACSLAPAGLRIAVIERQATDSLSDPAFDGRDIALTHRSVTILSEIGAWKRIPETEISPILEAKVLSGQSHYALDFNTHDTSIDALGYLVSNHIIRKALFEEASLADNVDILTDSTVVSTRSVEDHTLTVLDDERRLEAALVVAADSRFSDTRRMMGISASMHDFGRICIVCRMEHEQPHHGIAFECFHYGQTLAVLPLRTNISSIVITAPMPERERIMTMTPEYFNDYVKDRFENRYGNMSLVTERFAYPLVGVHSNHFQAARFALIGDAAVGMHPVTAHGFNLGLSGQAILAEGIRKAVNQGTDIGAPDLLKAFEFRHMQNTRPMYHGTNGIVKLFTDDRPGARVARKLVLRLANNFPPIKYAIRRKLTESGQPGRLLLH